MSSKKPGGRQHFVPQFYLRQWANEDDRLWQYGFDGRPPVHMSIKKIAFQRGLYTHPAKDKVQPLKTEDDLAGLEGIYASVWPDIIDRAEDLETRRNVARFIAVMFLRHPQHRTVVEMLNERLRKAVEGLEPDAEVEFVGKDWNGKLRVREILDGISGGQTAIASGFLSIMRSNTEDIAEVLLSRRWGVVFSEVPAFVTSDCPVVLSRASCERQTFGLGTPGTEILFPCSPYRLLAMSDDFPYEFAHYKLADADIFHRKVAQGAVRFVYASKDDLELARKIKGWREG